MDTQEVGMKGEPYIAGSSARFSALTWRGGRARSEGRLKGAAGLSVYTRLIHFVLQQNPTQHCQAIILQCCCCLKKMFPHQDADLGRAGGVQVIPSAFQDACVSPGQSLSVSYGIIF